MNDFGMYLKYRTKTYIFYYSNILYTMRIKIRNKPWTQVYNLYLSFANLSTVTFVMVNINKIDKGCALWFTLHIGHTGD